MMRKILTILCLLLFLLPSISVQASEYSVRPFLIDVEVLPRDVVTKTVTLTNDSPHRKYIIFATVNEITIDNEGEIKQFVSPVMTDRSVTVTSWIEVRRARIEVPPGESIEVPITFKISPYAEPGEYHAFIGFVPAANRPLAERTAMNGDADGVVVKVKVVDKREDSMHISAFLVDRFVMGDDDRNIQVEIENVGEITSAPVGEIIFYDSRGVEVDAIPFNTEAEVIEAGTKKTLTASIPLDGDLGRFKANLLLRYGENQSAQLQDTTFFYMMPLNLMIIVGGVTLLLALFVTYLFKRSFLRDEYEEDSEEVPLYVRDGHDPNPMDHDIDLKNTSRE